MGYTRTTWTDGDIITAAKLNNLEQGVGLANPNEVIVETDGAVTQALDAGVIYHFEGDLTALTITLNAPATGQMTQYHFDFISGSTAPTLTMPSQVYMPDDFVVVANKIYEIDILNGLAVVQSWTFEGVS